MRNLLKPVKNKHIRIKIVVILITVALILTAIGYLVIKINDFFNRNYLQFNQVVQVKLQTPVEIKERVTTVNNIIQIASELPEITKDPLEKYICEKWGIADCKIALAVAKAESGMREDAININTNNTIDVGIFQINSVHFKQAGCSLKDITDAYKNVDCAYSIFKSSGWNAWVAFTKGYFVDKLK